MKKRRDTSISLETENLILKTALANIRLWLGRDAGWVIPEGRGMVKNLLRVCDKAGMTYDKALDITGHPSILTGRSSHDSLD